MIIQVLLTLGVMGVLLYALAHRRQAPAVAAFISAGSILGCFLVWSPGHASGLAQAVGVGRGADLIFYLWIVISAAIMANLHIKLRAANAELTALVRHVALITPTYPPASETAGSALPQPSLPPEQGR